MNIENIHLVRVVIRIYIFVVFCDVTLSRSLSLVHSGWKYQGNSNQSCNYSSTVHTSTWTDDEDTYHIINDATILFSFDNKLPSVQVRVKVCCLKRNFFFSRICLPVIVSKQDEVHLIASSKSLIDVMSYLIFVFFFPFWNPGFGCGWMDRRIYAKYQSIQDFFDTFRHLKNEMKV